jgi:hypothetical protein
MASIPVPLAESHTWRVGRDPIRACLFCVHGTRRLNAEDRRCRATQVVNSVGKDASCIDARGPAGPCGIEAKFLQLAGEFV